MIALLIILLVLAVVGLPVWRPVENRSLYGGWAPSGGLGLILLVLLLLVLLGHIRL